MTRGSIILLLASFLQHETFADLIVSLPDGKIRGYERNSPGNITFYAFQGIPYAKPPIGSLRFQPPELPEKWDGILNTTEQKGICYQVTSDENDETEDCLYLNVYTPALNLENGTKLPVLFWIYGGGFSHGSARYTTMGPDFLLEKDVVVVNFNYRVGPFGFLSTGDEVIPGNMGLKDQLLALKWTKKNIALFGGDPDKITLLGQSAGSASVGYHVLSKQSSGLFRAAIGDSGSPLNIWAFLDKENSISYAVDLAKKLTTTTNVTYDSKLLKDIFLNASATAIDQATKTTIIKTALPVMEIEHEGAFLTEKMYGLLETGDFNQVPLLIGTNNEEEIHKVADLDNLREILNEAEENPSMLIPTNIPLKFDSNTTIVGEKIFNLYFNGVQEEEKLGHLVRYFSDTQFSRAVIKHAELQSKYTDVYFYVFSYHGIMGNNNKTIKGADRIDHGEETKYYVQYVLKSYNNRNLETFPELDVLTHKRMVEMWTNFAKYLNPIPEPVDLLQNVTWPKVNPEKYLYLDIDEELQVKELPKGRFYEGWKRIFDAYGDQPFTTY